MLRIPCVRASGARYNVRLLHSSVSSLNVKNVPPSSIPPLNPVVIPVENPTPVTPSTPNLSSSATTASPPSPPPPPPPKKKHRLRRFMLTMTFLGAVVYGGGVWFSLRNDNFHDFFTEFIPLGERIVLAIEEREFQRRFPNAGRKPLEENTPHVTVHRGGATWKMISEGEYKGPATGPHVSAIKPAESDKPVSKKEVVATPPPVVPAAAVKSPAPAVATPAPLVIKEKVLPKLPKLVFEGDIDPSLDGVVKAINSVFVLLSKTGEVAPEEISGLASCLGDVSKQFVEIKATYEKNLVEAVEQQLLASALRAEQAANEYNKKLAEIDEKWKEGYFAERQRILETYKRRLTEELKKFTQAYNVRLQNEVTAAIAETERKLAETLVEKVESERDGRLAKLENVKAAFTDLITASAESEKFIETAEKTAQLELALGSLTNALSKSYSVPLGPHLAKIKEVGGDDPLIAAAIAAVPVSAYDGVLSPAQLVARFKLMSPEIRNASLVPEGAGVAGFFGSWLLSKLMFKKEGKPKGSDVESVLARAESALMEGQVTEAVAEINSLTGWRKQLAADWLAEGRKRSEVEFLVNVLSEEGRLWQYKV